MIKPWRKGSTLTQKLAIGLLLILVFWPFQVFISHRFVPSEGYLRVSVWAALGFTVFFLLLMFHVRRTSPVKTVFPYSGFKKVGVILLMPLLIYGFAWINIAVAAPQAITVLLGREYLKTDLARKDRRSGSRRSCDYRLKIETVDFIFYHYCIPWALYHKLPQGEFAVNVRGKVSALGVHIDEIDLADR